MSPCKVTQSQAPWMRMWTSWGGGGPDSVYDGGFQKFERKINSDAGPCGSKGWKDDPGRTGLTLSWPSPGQNLPGWVWGQSFLEAIRGSVGSSSGPNGTSLQRRTKLSLPQDHRLPSAWHCNCTSYHDHGLNSTPEMYNLMPWPWRNGNMNIKKK